MKQIQPKEKPVWGDHADDIIRIEIRSRLREEEKVRHKCECGKETTVHEMLVNNVNQGVKVAYFIPVHKMEVKAVIYEAIQIIKLIFRGWHKQKYDNYEKWQKTKRLKRSK